MKKSGFTLVEMLIVVLVIGILAAAILPRLTNYMAKTRDLKRQADLKNIAAAIEMYRTTHGKMPTRQMTDLEKKKTETGRYFHHALAGYASALHEELKSYITTIPRDPSKQNAIAIYAMVTRYINKKTNAYDARLVEERFGKNLRGGTMYKPGEYFYNVLLNQPYSLKTKSEVDSVGVLITKVETPEAANYVLSAENDRFWDTKGGLRPGIASWVTVNGKQIVTPTIEIKDIALCSSVSKAKKGEKLIYPIRDGEPCTYSSKDQLYYILKID